MPPFRRASPASCGSCSRSRRRRSRAARRDAARRKDRPCVSRQNDCAMCPRSQRRHQPRLRSPCLIRRSIGLEVNPHLLVHLIVLNRYPGAYRHDLAHPRAQVAAAAISNYAGEDIAIAMRAFQELVAETHERPHPATRSPGLGSRPAQGGLSDAAPPPYGRAPARGLAQARPRSLGEGQPGRGPLERAARPRAGASCGARRVWPTGTGCGFFATADGSTPITDFQSPDRGQPARLHAALRARASPVTVLTQLRHLVRRGVMEPDATAACSTWRSAA